MSPSNLGKEMKDMRPSNTPIEAICINNDLDKVAIASMGSIKFYSTKTWVESSEDRIDISKNSGQITQMHWTKDGSIISLTTSQGYFVGFLTVVPQLFSAYKSYAALLSSLTEVSIIDVARNNMIIGKAELEIEPHHINIGSDHFAVGINDGVWFYRWRPIGAIDVIKQSALHLVCKREYNSTVKKVVMNDVWAAALAEGQVFLHQIEDDVQQMRKFPMNKNQEVPIVDVEMAGDFLIMIDG
jgi:WD repeat-containing protein 19